MRFPWIWLVGRLHSFCHETKHGGRTSFAENVFSLARPCFHVSTIFQQFDFSAVCKLKYNYVFWGKLCPPNPPISSRDRVQTRLMFTVFIVWWPWKLGQGHQNLLFFIIRIIQYIKFGHNPSFGSRDRVQIGFFGQNFTFKVLMWPWKLGQGHHNLTIFFACLSGVFV